jgi:hypothetical protein
MANGKITNDMEFWQLKEDYARSLLAVRTETDKKRKKELEKEMSLEKKLLDEYEKRKIKHAKEQEKAEEKLSKMREKTTADPKTFFEVSPVELKYVDYVSLNKTQREKLAVKKESLLASMHKGMYLKVKGDPNIYQIKQSEKRMNGMTYVSTVVYGDVTIQDIALMITGYYYENEIGDTGHTIID